MHPKISIAMATYNGEKYLSEQLDSLAKQTIPPFELVVCDDRSQDETVSIVEEFSKTAPFPVCIHINERTLGFADNFLKAASLCEGDWIAFCDQDDVWLSIKTARIIEAISQYRGSKLVMIGHASLISGPDLSPTGATLYNSKRDYLIPRQGSSRLFFMHGFSIVLLASLIKQFDHAARPASPWSVSSNRIGHDDWLCLLAAALGDIAFISEPLVLWRRHSASLSQTPPSMALLSKIKTSGAMIDHRQYFKLATLSKFTCRALSKLASSRPSQGLSDLNSGLLDEAVQKHEILSQRFMFRAKLYRSTNLRSRVAVFLTMFATNAYLGPKYYSLGFKALLKDAAWALGVMDLRKWR